MEVEVDAVGRGRGPRGWGNGKFVIELDLIIELEEAGGGIEGGLGETTEAAEVDGLLARVSRILSPLGAT